MTTILRKLHRAFCRKVCGHADRERPEVPFKVREESHALSNAVTSLQGSVGKVTRETDALADLARDMHYRRFKYAGGGGGGGGRPSTVTKK